eukprot:1762935-Prymnesium_polylepis.2
MLASHEGVHAAATPPRSPSTERRSICGYSDSSSLGSRRVLNHRNDSIEMRTVEIVQQADNAENRDTPNRSDDRRKGPAMPRSPRPNLDNDAKAVGHSTKKASVGIGHLTGIVVGKLTIRILVERESTQSRPPISLTPLAHGPLGAFFRIRGQPEPELAVSPNPKPSESSTPQRDAVNHVGVRGLGPAQKVTKLERDTKIGAATAAAQVEKGHGRAQALPQKQPRSGMVARNITLEDHLARDAERRNLVTCKNARVPGEH